MHDVTGTEKVNKAISFVKNIITLVNESGSDNGYFDSYTTDDQTLKLKKQVSNILDNIADIDVELNNFQHLHFVSDIIVLLLMSEKLRRNEIQNKLISES